MGFSKLKKYSKKSLKFSGKILKKQSHRIISDMKRNPEDYIVPASELLLGSTTTKIIKTVVKVNK